MPDPKANTEVPLQITSPEAWGTAPVKDEGDIVELPSGHVARIRRTMSILRIVQDGSIPNPLRGVVMGMITSQTMNMPKGSESDPRLMSQFADFLDGVAIETMIEPAVDRPLPRGKAVDEKGALINPDESDDEYYERISDWVPKPGCISVFALDVTDKMFLFIYAQGAAADAKSFREFTAASLDAMEDGKEPPMPTKRTGGTGTGRKSAAKRKPAAKKGK